MSAKGTPAITAADLAGIAYTLHEYQHHPGADSFGLEAADALGCELARVHKTLVAAIDGPRSHALVVAVVPVDSHLDLKALASALGSKRAEMAKPADAERATGYVVGGISPLGQRKRLPTVVDASAVDHATIFVSAGRRGLELELRATDLVSVTGGLFAAIAGRLATGGRREAGRASKRSGGAQPPCYRRD